MARILAERVATSGRPAVDITREVAAVAVAVAVTSWIGWYSIGRP